jgi:hypothetical protein
LVLYDSLQNKKYTPCYNGTTQTTLTRYIKILNSRKRVNGWKIKHTVQVTIRRMKDWRRYTLSKETCKEGGGGGGREGKMNVGSKWEHNTRKWRKRSLSWIEFFYTRQRLQEIYTKDRSIDDITYRTSRFFFLVINLKYWEKHLRCYSWEILSIYQIRIWGRIAQSVERRDKCWTAGIRFPGEIGNFSFFSTALDPTEPPI